MTFFTIESIYSRDGTEKEEITETVNWNKTHNRVKKSIN